MTKLKFNSVLFLGAIAILFSVATQSFSQEAPPNLTKEELAKNNKLFIELASKALKWDVPMDPVKIVGPLYFVGTTGLSSWLFVTSEGNFLAKAQRRKGRQQKLFTLHALRLCEKS